MSRMRRRATSRVRRPRLMSLADVWAYRLGIDSADDADRAARADRLEQELHARFDHLCQFVLCGGMPPAGKSSVEAAVAFGDLWVLTGFLGDAQRLMSGETNDDDRGLS